MVVTLDRRFGLENIPSGDGAVPASEVARVRGAGAVHDGL
jgi:hypothetical protein